MLTNVVEYNDNKNYMRVTRYFILVLISLMLFSCLWDEDTFIKIIIVNAAYEDLNARYYRIVPANYFIPKGSSYTIFGTKGTLLTITGKESGIDYGSKRYSSDATWVIY